MVNRLANEPSPYLRQHASNPVDWWPWGPEALAEAARLDRPLLISVGYSACHWCHVMAHESFENAETAALMNELFVNVKVDREERPDVDAVYMEATQAMTGSGGWPMTVFATPAGEPFFCGTYFPPRSLPGRPSFTEVCTAVASAWRDQRGDLLEQATRLTEHLQPADLRGHEPPGVGIINDAIQRLLSTLDPHNGGFGTAPKFPQPLALDLLLSHAAHTGDQLALDGVCRALDAMAAGGIHDHLAGGFARYSVDPIWLVPHFEKMLYDQALLLRVYTHAWQLTAETRYAWVAERIVDYLLTYLRSPQGGFYSAEDADSEGVEGKFYVWTPDQITAAIADHLPDAREASETATAAIKFWGVSNDGNFEGATILNRITHPDSLVGDERVETARKALLVERDTRVRPGLDDKVLTEWNALAVAALADAAAVFERDDWLAAAVTASHFLLDSLRDGDGRWLRAWQAEAGARHRAYASDHAALVDAFTRVAEATGDPTWLQEAATVAEELLEHFVDPDGGGLYTTAHDAEALVARPRDIQDGALPSATANAAFALQRLGALTGDHRYGSTAADLLRLTGRFVGAHPLAFPLSAQALNLLQRGVTQVVVAGDAPELVAAVRARWHPGVVLLWGTPGDSPLWQGRRPGVDAGQTPRAYVCHDQVCELPTDSPEELAAQLNGL